MRTLIAALCLTALLPFAAIAQDAPENLVKNPGFETIDEANQVPTDWRISDWNPKEQRGEVKLQTATDAVEGKRSAMIHKTGGPNIIISPTLTKPVKGSAKLRLKFSYKLTNKGCAYASFRTRGADKKWLQYTHTPKHTEMNEWKEAVHDFTADPNTNQLYIYIRTNVDGTLIDNVSLTEIP